MELKVVAVLRQSASAERGGYSRSVFRVWPTALRREVREIDGGASGDVDFQFAATFDAVRLSASEPFVDAHR